MIRIIVALLAAILIVPVTAAPADAAAHGSAVKITGTKTAQALIAVSAKRYGVKAERKDAQPRLQLAVWAVEQVDPHWLLATSRLKVKVLVRCTDGSYIVLSGTAKSAGGVGTLQEALLNARLKTRVHCG